VFPEKKDELHPDRCCGSPVVTADVRRCRVIRCHGQRGVCESIPSDARPLHQTGWPDWPRVGPIRPPRGTRNWSRRITTICIRTFPLSDITITVVRTVAELEQWFALSDLEPETLISCPVGAGWPDPLYPGRGKRSRGRSQAGSGTCNRLTDQRVRSRQRNGRVGRDGRCLAARSGPFLRQRISRATQPVQ